MDCTWQVCQARLTRLLPCWQLYSVIRSPCARLMWKLILFLELNLRAGRQTTHSNTHSFVLRQ